MCIYMYIYIIYTVCDLSPDPGSTVSSLAPGLGGFRFVMGLPPNRCSAPSRIPLDSRLLIQRIQRCQNGYVAFSGSISQFSDVSG